MCRIHLHFRAVGSLVFRQEWWRASRAMLLASGIAVAGFPISAQWTEVYVPEEMSEWTRWVAEGLPDSYWCPWHSDKKVKLSCVWPIELRLDLERGSTGTETSFVLEVETFRRTDISLPHGKDRVPYDVRLNGDLAVVGSTRGRPTVVADEGRHRITGNIRSPTYPKYIELPQGLVRLQLWLDGERITRPSIDGSRLLLQERDDGEAREADSLLIRVYRLLQDDVPQSLITVLLLSVGGKNREIELGKVLPEGFSLVSIESSLPARTNAAGELSVLARSGAGMIELLARANGHMDVFASVRPSEQWPASEIWGVEANEDIRSIRIEGVSPTDLSQTESPFSDVSGYVVNEGQALSLVEVSRGDTSPNLERVTVRRRLWLSFDGASWLANDQINASVNRESRMSANYPLGRVEIHGRARLITTVEDGPESGGISVPAGDLKIEAVSEFAATRFPFVQTFGAAGWDVDASSLALRAFLPPQWLPIWAGGADSVRGTWVHKWTLWDVFLIALLAVIATKLIGWRWAAVVAATSILVFVYSSATVVGWLVLVSILSLERAIKSAPAQRWVSRLFWIAALPVFSISAATAVIYVLDALYPQLDVEMRYEQFEQRSPDIADAVAPPDEFFFDPIEEERYRAKDAERFARPKTETMMIEARNVVQESTTSQPPPFERAGIEEPVWVQTGPGLPDWPDEGIESLELSWSGPVGAEQEVRLLLLPPIATRLVSLVTAGLILLTLWLFVRIRLRPDDWGNQMSRGAGLLPLLLVVLIVPDAFAQTPDKDLLDELEQRFLAPPSCLPGCASLEAATIEIDKDELLLVLRVHVDPHQDATAVSSFGVPIPTVAPSLLPDRAWIGEAKASLLRPDGAQLFARLAPGIHTVRLRYVLAGLDRIDIQFPLPPSRVQKAPGGSWNFVVDPDRAYSLDSLSLRRQLREKAAVADDEWGTLQETLTPFADVKRWLLLNRDPSVITRVERWFSEPASPIELEISLITGEWVTDERVEVKDGIARFTLAPDEQSYSWTSRLDPNEVITLESARNVPWTESWRIVQSDYLNASFSGLTPIRVPLALSSFTAFQPRPGEKLEIALSRPQPMDGRSVTVRRAQLTTEASGRYRESTLDLEVLASLGDSILVKLPQGAFVKNIDIPYAEMPVPDGNEVTLRVEPGISEYQIEWLDEAQLGTWFLGPRVEMSVPLRNVENKIGFPTNRWVLWLGGPGMGPGILSWGIILIVVAIAIALTRIPRFPLRPVDAVLLSLGVTLANLSVALLVAVWFLAIWYRREKQPSPDNRKVYLGMQALFVLLSAIAVLAIVKTVPQALLGHPQMEVFGLDSHAHKFYWFNDRTDGAVPSPTIISLPLWVYRVLMIGWGFWLAFALVRWVRVAWGALCFPYLWPPKSVPAEPAGES